MPGSCVDHPSVVRKNKRICMLDTNIDVLDMQQTVNLAEQYVLNRTPLHLCGVNADKINQMKQNERLKQIINDCGIIHADGISVVMASKFLNKPLPERVAGIDLMMKLIELSAEKGYRVYLLGAEESVITKAAENIRERYPALILAGFRNGYFKKEQWPRISRELEAAKPDFVFVGITSPMKEYLIEYLQEEGHRSVFMGVGGSFDVIAGKVSRAPIWLQRMGLEWVYRMMQEPRRLLKRYVVGNWTFIQAVCKEKFIK